MRSSPQVLYTALLAYHTTYLNIRALFRTEIDLERAQSSTPVVRAAGARRNSTTGESASADVLSIEEVQKWYFEKLKFRPAWCGSTLVST